MADLTERPSGVGDLLAGLRDISGRLARFEDVPEAEMRAWKARKLALLGHVDTGALL